MIMIITCYYHISSSICVWVHIKQTATGITRRSLCQDVRFFTRHSSQTHRQVSSFFFFSHPYLSLRSLSLFVVFWSFNRRKNLHSCNWELSEERDRMHMNICHYFSIVIFFRRSRNRMVYVRITGFIIDLIYTIHHVSNKTSFSNWILRLFFRQWTTDMNRISTCEWSIRLPNKYVFEKWRRKRQWWSFRFSSQLFTKVKIRIPKCAVFY